MSTDLTLSMLDLTLLFMFLFNPILVLDDNFCRWMQFLFFPELHDVDGLDVVHVGLDFAVHVLVQPYFGLRQQFL